MSLDKKMNAVDSPVDALAFDYVRIGLVAVVNSLWAWVAVVTATVNFWRIRAGNGPGAVQALTAGFSSPVKSTPTDRTSPEPSTSESSVPAAPTSSGFYEGGNVSVTKGKFVVYYEEEREDDGNGEGDGDVELTEWGDGGDWSGEWWNSWEKVLKVRRGETGWYRYQDLTALSGNVVRLWDGVRDDSLVW